MLHPLIAILTNSGEVQPTNREHPQSDAVPLAVIINVVAQAAALIGEMVGTFSVVVLLSPSRMDRCEDMLPGG